MKRFLACLSCALLGGFPCFAQFDEALAQIKEADVHALLRQTAVKVEEKVKGAHAEADGLAQQVEEILAAPEPPKAAGGDRNQQRAAEMRLIHMTAGASAALGSVRGFVFDNSSAGQRQRYQELEMAAHDDAADVMRWLEMRHLAEKLNWEEKEKLCGERALGAARALVAREAKNAEAHALLAEALDWEDGAETLRALQRSLELDPKQPRALQLMLDRRMQKVLHSAALRRESGLDEKLPTPIHRLLYDTPLSEEEMLTLGKRQDELRREAEALLKLAQERGDLAVYLLMLQDLVVQLRWHAQMAAMALRREPHTSYEEFLQQVMQQGLMHFFTVFADEKHLHDALRLAADDPEVIGAIMLIALGGDAMTAFSRGKPPSRTLLSLAEETTARLAEMAKAGSGLKEARASESACVIQWMALMMGQRPPHVEMILHTIRLDPFRHRTLNMLLMLCMQKEDLRGARAVALIQLALVPDEQTRRMAAAAAAKNRDWPAAHRLLDACLKDRPHDVPLLNQRAATLLKENQSKATQRKAALLYDKIEKLLEEKGAQPGKEELEILVRNGVLFLAICGKSAEAQSRLASAMQAGTISEKAAKELESWLSPAL